MKGFFKLGCGGKGKKCEYIGLFLIPSEAARSFLIMDSEEKRGDEIGKNRGKNG